MVRMGRKGSLTVEASIILPVVIFVIVSIVSIIKIVNTHAVIQHAINETANEIANYSYIYSKTGMQKAHDNVSEDLKDRSELFESHYEEVIGALGALNSEVKDTKDEVSIILEGDANNIDNIEQNVNKAMENINEIKDVLDEIIYHPDGASMGIKNEVASMISMFANGYFENFKGAIGSQIAKMLMRKHLEINNFTANQRLKSMGIKDGLKGLDFSKTRVFEDSRTIDIVVSYEINLPVPIKIFPKPKITQRVIVKAWLDGDGFVPEIEEKIEHEDTVWDLEPIFRGRKIVDDFGGNVSNRTGDSVNMFNTEDNQAVKIRSIDTTLPIQRAGEFQKTMISTIDNINSYKGIIRLKGDKQKKEYTISSKKVLIVIPEDTIDSEIQKQIDYAREYAKKFDIGFEVVEYQKKNPEKKEE
ncbi:UNVERIFIED_CONTAM: hypothetical protein Cloal_2633 [Acetivibrio alkalicellulosi]